MKKLLYILSFLFVIPLFILIVLIGANRDYTLSYAMEDARGTLIGFSNSVNDLVVNLVDIGDVIPWVMGSMAIAVLGFVCCLMVKLYHPPTVAKTTEMLQSPTTPPIVRR